MELIFKFYVRFYIIYPFSHFPSIPFLLTSTKDYMNNKFKDVSQGLSLPILMMQFTSWPQQHLFAVPSSHRMESSGSGNVVQISEHLFRTKGRSIDIQ